MRSTPAALFAAGVLLLASLIFTQTSAAAVFTTNTIITEDDLTYDGEDIIVSAATVAIDGPHSFNSVQLTNNGILTHSPCTTNETHRLDLTVANAIVVTADSRIDVFAKGYLPNHTTGNTTIGGSVSASGGSYGGLGSGLRANAVYGDYATPEDWGSGAANSRGGGRVKLVARSLHLDGEILANGASTADGGAGGAVLVVVTNLTGSGRIEASGGRAGMGGYGGGGGGRIAVYASDYSGFNLANIKALGGKGAQRQGEGGSAGGAGTVYLRDRDEALGTLLIDASGGGGYWTPLGLAGTNLTVLPDFVVVRGTNTHVRAVSPIAALDFGTNLTVNGGAYLALVGSNTVFRAAIEVSNAQLDVNGRVDLSVPFALTDDAWMNVTALTSSQPLTVSGSTLVVEYLSLPELLLTNKTVLTHLACTATETHRLDVNVAGVLTVSADSLIDVSSKGYPGGRTSGNTTNGASTINSGGSYGGLGVSGWAPDRGSGVPNAVYGDYADPEDWGSGGKDWGGEASICGGIVNSGGAGGGLVRITANVFELAGMMLADGNSPPCGGGGSGGGIWASVQTLSGMGIIRASGGNGNVSGLGIGGAGGGGRVAIYAVDYKAFPLGNISAPGGLGVNENGEAGTVYLRNTSGGVITANTTITEDDMSYEGQDIVVSNATLTINGPHSFKSLLLTNNAVLTHLACTETQTHQLDLNVAGLIVVSTDSRIDVSGKGYLAGRTSGNTAVGASTGSSGGGYGGLGGNSYGAVNAVYGDYASPEEWGSGSSSETGSTAAGGGRLKLVAQSLQLDGQILANGAVDCSAGSGGAVLVVVTNLTGSGSIVASGGNIGCADWGGGGGGRIAVYASNFTDFELNNLTALGGSGNPDGSDQRDGGAGTVWLVNGSLLTHVQYTVPGRLSVYPTNNPTFLTSALLTNGVAIQFNKTIDTNSFSPEKFVIRGPHGDATLTGLEQIGDRLYRIEFPPQTENGSYQFVLLSTLRDVDGFQLDQNANGIPGEPEDSYTFTLILDTIPPHITQHAPAGDIAGTITNIDVWFSEPIDSATFTDISIRNPTNGIVPVNSITEVGLNRFRISFAPQTGVGQYHALVAPNIADLAGNLLDQDNDGLSGEAGDDLYDAAFNLTPVDLPLVISPVLAPSGDFVLTFTSQIGRSYIIEVSTDLAIWQAATNFISTTETIEFVDRDTVGVTERFYRVTTP